MRVTMAAPYLLVVAFVACGGVSPSSIVGDGGSSEDTGSANGRGTGDASGGTGSSGSDGGAGNTSDASAGVACGATACTPPGQICCVPTNGGAPACETGSTCSGQNAVGLQCTSSADCPGQVCCFDQNRAACATTCSGGAVQLCDPAATSNSCPQGRQCRTGQIDGLPSSIGACGG